MMSRGGKQAFIAAVLLAALAAFVWLPPWGEAIKTFVGIQSYSMGYR